MPSTERVTLPEADYRARVEDGVVVGGRCPACGYATAPATPRCPSCGGAVQTPVGFAPAGTVWGATILHLPVGDRLPPYGLAYVDVLDGPRVLAVFDAQAPLAVGARVTLSQTGDDLVAATTEDGA